MKRFGSFALIPTVLFLVFALSPPTAQADQVTLTFNSTGGASAGGYYVYPYYFTVQNGSTIQSNVPLMCVSFDNHIEGGESWIADVVSAASLGTQYEEDAYLLHKAASSADPNVISNAQWAAWYLSDSGIGLTNPATGMDISSLLAAAAANAGSFAMYDVFVPEIGSQSGDLGTPQEFVGPTPEPGTLLLLGTAILGLACMLYFRKQRQVQGIARF